MPSSAQPQLIPHRRTHLISNIARGLWRRRAARKFLSEVPLTESDSVIDVGCRSGVLVSRIAEVVTGGRVVGVDSSERNIRRALRRCAQYSNVEFYVGEIEALQWEGRFFDYAICLDWFHECANPGVTLTEILRILKSGGELFLGVREYLDGDGTNSGRRFVRKSSREVCTPQEYVRYLEQSGFMSVQQKFEAEYLLTIGTRG